MFTIFKNISIFCIEYEKHFNCFICNKNSSEKSLYNSLISLTNNDLLLNSINDIINSKFLPTIAKCECVNNSNLMCMNINYNLSKLSDFVFIILDITKDYYFKNIHKIKNLFLNNTNINNLNYEINCIICYQGSLHYYCYIINNQIEF